MTVKARIGGAAANDIVTAAAWPDAKRIIVGGRRRTLGGKIAFGSTPREIILTVPCPVTFVRDIYPL